MVLEIGLFTKDKKERKKKRKEIKISLRLGYPNSYFYDVQQKM